MVTSEKAVIQGCIELCEIIGLRLHSRNDPNESLKIIWNEQNGLLKPLNWLFRPRSNRAKIGLALFEGR